MDKLILKPATKAQREWAALLLSDSEPWTKLGVTLKQCRTVCHDKVFQLYIAHINKIPCGLIILQKQGVAGSPYIKSIAVTSEYRNRGIGTLMLKQVEQMVQKKSKYIFLCVSSFNQRAKKFYLQNGYRVVGKLENYIIDGYNEILMYKKLR